MLVASYALHIILSNSRSVLTGKNYSSSTFAPKPSKFGLFPHFLTDWRTGTKAKQRAAMWKKCSTSAILLLFLVGNRQSLAAASCAVSRVRQSVGATHTSSSFPETDVASGIYSDRAP